MGRWRRRLAWTGVAVAALLALLLGLVQSAPIESRVRTWLVGAGQAPVAARSRRRRPRLQPADAARAAHRRLAVGRGPRRRSPFFTARRVSVEVPWAAYAGTLRLSSLGRRRRRVTLVRERGQIWSTCRPRRASRRLWCRGISISAGSPRAISTVDYVDRTGDIEVGVRGMNIEFSEIGDQLGYLSAGGTTRAAESVRARVGERATASQPVKGTHGLRRQPRVARSADRRRSARPPSIVSGRVNRVLDDTSFDLTLEGTLDMAPLVEWAPPPVPVSGAGTFDRQHDRPAQRRNEIRLAFRAPSLTVARAEPCRSTATCRLPRRGRWSSGSAWSRRGRPGHPTGRARSRAGAPTRSAPAPLELQAAFRDLDLDLALAAYGREPLVVAAWEEGTARLSRAAPGAPLRHRAPGPQQSRSPAAAASPSDGRWTRR